MKHSRNASLKSLNSFSVEARANHLFEIDSASDLQQLVRDIHFDPRHDLILGGGSNILFAGDVEGKVLLNRISGRKILDDTRDSVLLEASAGENWHQLVLWSLARGLSGIENLSLIPGLSGAAPMQNIGAYGVELSEVLESVLALDLESGALREFSNRECRFAYRDSRFKSADAGHYLITHIRLRLNRHFIPRLGYAGLGEELAAMGIQHPTASQVSAAVIRIRQRKLPDPAVTGNAGSFFKNPVVNRETARSLSSAFAGLPVFPAGDDQRKLGAAWMIEHCGWKGRRVGAAAVSPQHALVLVNRGGATGAELLALADRIRESVQNTFGVELQIEPRIVRT